MKSVKNAYRPLMLLGALLLSFAMMGQDPNFHIYLCFGQSNMEGLGEIEEQDQQPDPRFRVLQAIDCEDLGRKRGEWYTATPPLVRCDKGISPADYFGRTMTARLPDSVRVGVICVAVGGCDIRLFDKDLYLDYDSRDGQQWFARKVESYDGNPYRHLIGLAKKAMNEGVIKGILLHQGETNTGDTLWPNYVEKIYLDILSDLCLEAEAIPLLAGEMLSAPDNCCSTMNPIINTLPEVIPTAHIVSSDGCPGMDRAHFNSAGYRILGKRYAEKMLSLYDRLQ